MKDYEDTNFDEEKWKDYRERIDRKLWRYIDENGQYISSKYGCSYLYPYISKFKFDWENCQMPKETNHLSRYKTITIDYELATLHTEDKLLEFFSGENPFENIKVITIHSGYTRDPLGKHDDNPECEEEKQ